jgi:outer membrane biosynthesis protein TonB
MNLDNYIRGIRKGKEINRLEREAMRDPFLADALEGYDTVKGNHEKRMNELQKRITQQTHRPHNHIWLNRSIAASILLLMSIGAYLFYFNDYSRHTENLIAEHKTENPVAAEKDEYSPLEVLEEEAAATITPPVMERIQTEIVSEPIRTNDAMAEYESAEIVIKSEKEMAVKQSPDISLVESKITVKDTSPVNNSSSLLANKVQGIITDMEGEPLIGATVSSPGTSNKTLTNMDGYFEMSNLDTNKIKVDYIGYESLNLPVDTSKPMLIAMKEDVTSLSEVVVVGYASKQKRSMTGSATIIEATNPVENFKNYVKRELRHPSDDACKEVKGKVKLSFAVNENGRPYNITVLKSLCPSADQEAIRLVEEGPDWESGAKPTQITIKF